MRAFKWAVWPPPETSWANAGRRVFGCQTRRPRAHSWSASWRALSPLSHLKTVPSRSASHTCALDTRTAAPALRQSSIVKNATGNKYVQVLSPSPFETEALRFSSFWKQILFVSIIQIWSYKKYTGGKRWKDAKENKKRGRKEKEKERKGKISGRTKLTFPKSLLLFSLLMY